VEWRRPDFILDGLGSTDGGVSKVAELLGEFEIKGLILGDFFFT
jgi:hypothetical protein